MMDPSGVVTEPYKTRKWVWWIGIVDLILTSLSLAVVLLAVLVAGMFTAVANDEKLQKEVLDVDQKNENSELTPEIIASHATYMTIIVWTVVFIVSVVVIIQLVAAVKLLNASQLGKNPALALRLCKFWRTVTIVFTVMIVLSLFSSFQGPLEICIDLLNIGVRCLALYFVNRFMNELTAGPMIPIYQNPDTAVYYPPQVPINPYDPPAYDECVKLKV